MRRYSGLDPDSKRSRRISSDRDDPVLTTRSNLPDDLLLLMTVDLGHNRLEQLPVRQGDDPTLLARSFCARHKLPGHLCEVLAETIACNVRQRRGLETDRSAGEKTPNKTSRPPSGYSGKFEERQNRSKPDLNRFQSVKDQRKSVQALVQKALATKENATPSSLTRSSGRSGSGSTLQSAHRRSSSLTESIQEKLKDDKSHGPKVTHVKERSEQYSQKSPQKPGAKSRQKSPISTGQQIAPAMVIMQIKKHRYAEIYRAIKPAAETVLRASKIRTDLVHSGLIDILKPLLDELRDMEETLTLEEFQASMENLVAVLSKAEKNVLFYPFEIGEETEGLTKPTLPNTSLEVTECTFKPQKAGSHFRSQSTLM